MSEAGESDSWGEEGASCSEGDGVSESGEESECEDIESEADMGDDEDQSWKVRRASVKCILTMLSTIHNSRSGKYKNFYKRITDTFYKEVVPVLISRFSEREEKIKLDVFDAFVEVLRQADDNNILLDHTAFSRDVFSKLGCGFQHKSAAIRTSSLNLAKSTIKICGIAEVDRNFLCEYSLTRHLKVPDRVTDARTRVSALQCFIVLLEKTHTFLDVLDVEGLWHCSTILLLCEQSDVIIHALQVIQKLHEYHSRSDNALPEPSSMTCCVDIGNACSKLLQEDNMEQIIINAVLSCLVTLANTPTVSVWIFKTLAHLLPLDNKQTRILTVKLIREILINTDRDGDEKSDSNVAIPDEFITYIPSFLRQASDSLKEASVSCLCVMVDFGVEEIIQAHVIGPILEDVWRLLRAPDDSTVGLLRSLLKFTKRFAELNFNIEDPTIVEPAIPSVLCLLKSPLLGELTTEIRDVFASLPLTINQASVLGRLRELFLSCKTSDRSPSEGESEGFSRNLPQNGIRPCQSDSSGQSVNLKRSCLAKCSAAFIVRLAPFTPEIFETFVADSLNTLSTTSADINERIYCASVLGEIGYIYNFDNLFDDFPERLFALAPTSGSPLDAILSRAYGASLLGTFSRQTSSNPRHIEMFLDFARQSSSLVIHAVDEITMRVHDGEISVDNNLFTSIVDFLMLSLEIADFSKKAA
eukprot:230125_1